MKNQIRIIAFQEEEAWIGQCLEYDVSAFGRTLEEMRERLMMAFRSEAQAGLSRLSQAPQHFQEMWDEAKFPATEKSDVDGNGVQFKLCA